MNISLAQSGQFTKEASEDFQAFASSLQETTRFGDEVILQNAALLQSLGQLDKEGLKTATEAALDMSAALGISLEAAVTLVGKAAAGEIGSFSRYGLIIEKGATNAETFTNVLTKLNTQFGGAAAAQVNTFAGAQEQLANTFGDTQESIGALITTSPAVIAIFKEFSNVLVDVQNTLNQNRAEIQKFVGVGLKGLVDGISLAVEAFLFLDRGVVGLQVSFDFLEQLFFKSIQTFNELVGSFARGTQQLLGFFGKSSEAVDGFIESQENAAKAAAELASGESDQIDKRLADQAKFEKGLKEFTQKNSDTLKKAIDDSIAADDNQTNTVLENINKKNAARQSEVTSEEAKLEGLALIEEQRKLIDDEAKLAEQEASQLRADENFRFLEDNLGRTKALQVQQQSEELIRLGKTEEARKKIKIATIEAEKKGLQSLFDFEKNTNAGRAANFKSTLSTISTLQQSNNKTLFAVGKASAIATGTIDGIAAVQKALASAPPPFNFILAGLVGVASAANLAKIASAKPPSFQQGGIVPGNQFQGDNVQANVNSGELILNRAQQGVIAGDIGGAKQTQQAILAALQGLGGPTIVQIDGREIARAMRDEGESGFAFAV